MPRLAVEKYFVFSMSSSSSSLRAFIVVAGCQMSQLDELVVVRNPVLYIPHNLSLPTLIHISQPHSSRLSSGSSPIKVYLNSISFIAYWIWVTSVFKGQRLYRVECISNDCTEVKEHRAWNVPWINSYVSIKYMCGSLHFNLCMPLHFNLCMRLEFSIASYPKRCKSLGVHF